MHSPCAATYDLYLWGRATPCCTPSRSTTGAPTGWNETNNEEDMMQNQYKQCSGGPSASTTSRTWSTRWTRVTRILSSMPGRSSRIQRWHRTSTGRSKRWTCLCPPISDISSARQRRMPNLPRACTSCETRSSWLDLPTSATSGAWKRTSWLYLPTSTIPSTWQWRIQGSSRDTRCCGTSRARSLLHSLTRQKRRLWRRSTWPRPEVTDLLNANLWIQFWGDHFLKRVTRIWATSVFKNSRIQTLLFLSVRVTTCRLTGIDRATCTIGRIPSV